jgi:hypothetical protein
MRPESSGLEEAVRRSTARSWLLSGAAHVGAICALDTIATATGLAVATSGLLSGLTHIEALTFLACSYLFWATGMSVNLRANWLLLVATGTSTNVLSKAAFNISGACTSHVGLRKFATGAGYVASELCMEAPYYIGAFGTAALTDSVTAIEALVFLGGANLGAAAYELGISRFVRAALANPRVTAFLAR